MLREVKPKNARSARAMAAKAPLLHENTKSTLFLKATTSSDLLNKLTTNLFTLKKPFAQRFTKKNAIHPFEDASSLEFFSEKNDTSLMVFSSHTKKRPHCLTFVRTFNGKVLDMLEGMIDPTTARTLEQFSSKARVAIGMKPMLSFSGPGFASEDPSSKFAIARSLFMDLFRGEEAENVDAEGLQMIITFVAAEEESVVDGVESKQSIYMRVWRVVTKKSGQKLPRVELEEMGPRIDFRLGRCQTPDPSMLKEALRKGKTSEPRTKKNIDTDIMGDKMGRIHLGKQDFSDLQTRKMKGLKRQRDEADDGELPDANEGEISGSELDFGEVDEDDGGDDDEDEDVFEEMQDLIDADGDEAEDEDIASPEKPKRQKLK